MIDYVNLSEAIEYYQGRSYIPVDIAWTADAEFINSVIRPDTYATYTPQLGLFLTDPVQGFLQWARETGKRGKFQATVPCFRAGEVDRTHRPYFMVNELFINEDKCVTSNTLLTTIISDAMTLLAEYTPVRLDQTGEHAYSIVDDCYDIKLGAYGMVSDSPYGRYLYGTGMAEPRLSYVVRRRRGLEN